MKKIVCIQLGIILIGMIMFFITNPSVYNKNYWKDIGLGESHLYADVIREFGEPTEIVHISDVESVVRYEGVSFIWYNADLNGIFVCSEITSSKISFGKKNVSVGMSKQEIQRIYNRGFIKPIKDLPNNELGYIDGTDDTWVYFKFNDKDVVNKIVLAHGV